MKKRYAAAGTALLALAFSVLVAVQPAFAAVGLRVNNGRIFEATGQELVFRGTSHPHVWFDTQTASYANIKSLGANAVRVVLGSGQRWTSPLAQVQQVVSLCETNRLICVLEVHDTTGFGEEGAAATLDQAASYWISVQSALTGHENTIVINIGNEPFGNNQAVSATWPTATSNAINRLRNAGFDHMLMVDAPMWGQDWQFIMRDNAPTVFNSDPDRNTVFSIHMYGVFDTAAEVTAYMESFSSRGLPLVVGEFGHNHSDGNPDEDTIMAQAQARRIGYFGWSWSGNGGGVEYLDQVTNFNVNQLTSWGVRLFQGPNGISTTSRQACVYGGCGGGTDTTPPTTPGTLSSAGVTAGSVNLSWGASTDNVAVTGYDVLRAPGASGGTFAVVGTSAGTSFSNTGLAANTTYRYQVRARDAAGNLSAVSNTVTVTTTGGGTGGGSCRVAYTISPWGGSNGFTAGLSLTNTGTTALSWTLTFTLPGGQAVTLPGWGATYTTSGQNVSVVGLEWNRSLPPNGSTSIGFNGTHTGSTAEPTAFSVNGSACTVA